MCDVRMTELCVYVLVYVVIIIFNFSLNVKFIQTTLLMMSTYTYKSLHSPLTNNDLLLFYNANR